MLYTKKITKALQIAAKLHSGQFRKSPENIPYITHPIAVVRLLSKYTDKEDVLVAAILHDTLEDTKYTKEEIIRDFGIKVCRIVLGVTEPKEYDNGKKMPWSKRKAAYLDNLLNDSQESLLVSAADKICNMEDQLLDYNIYGSEYLKRYNSTSSERYLYHEKVYQILKERLEERKILVLYKKLLLKTKSIR